MLEFEVRTETVKSGGGVLTHDMAVLPWGDFMMLQDAAMPRPGKRGNHEVLVKSGSIWVQNLELGERTKRKKGQSEDRQTTHVLYDNLYDRLRGGEHTKRSELAEDQLMGDFIREQRDFSRMLIDMRAFTPEEQAERMAFQRSRIDRLMSVRDERKIEARELMAEASELEDGLHRRNPVGMGFKSGAVIDRLQKRRKDAAAIWSHEVWRTRQVSLFIVYHMDLYGELWDALSMRPAVGEAAGQVRIFGENAYIENDSSSLLAETRGIPGLRAASRRLLEYRDIFASIKARPFCKNAAHVASELEEAAELCTKGDREKLRTVLRKIRRGLRWVFASDSLQMDVILPFSLLLDQLAKSRRRMRDNNGAFIKGPVTIPRSAAPELISHIESTLLDLRTKIRAKCNDDDLATKIKDRVELYVGTAQDYLAADDWRQAKHNLLQAAKYL